MAGSFGFEPDKYDISIAIGELELLPAVRHAPPDWLIIANGFSCREQIAHGTPRHALHLAEVLQMALRLNAPDPSLSEFRRYPESARIRQREVEVFQSMKRTSLGLAGLAAGAALLWKLFGKR